MVDPATFRGVLAQWPSGVTVVTTLADGAWHGMTASSFSSVSLDPPLVSVCLSRSLYSHELIAESGVFGINVLAKDQAEVARRFAGMVPGIEDRFAGESWTTAETGVPLLDSALGWLDCRVVHAHPGGDHTIFVGEVVAGHAARRTAPLLFHSRGWGQFADVLPDVATLADGGVIAGLRARGASEAVIGDTAARMAASGVRVRATVAGLDPVLAPASSVLVETPEQRDAALAHGVGTLEVALDPALDGALERVLDLVVGAADRTAVVLEDAFRPDRADRVLAAIAALAAVQVQEICVSDGAGVATPLEVRALLQEAVGVARPVPIRARLGDRGRLGMVNALTALKSGVHHFDTTLCGLDGAIATEDLVRLLGALDVETPSDAAELGRIAADLEQELAAHADLPLQLSDTPLATRLGTPSEDTALLAVTDTVGAAG